MSDSNPTASEQEDSTDPLADAEPGETVTIEREFESSPWNYADADDWVGRDRELESRLELVDVDDIGEQGREALRATYRAEVTKLEEPDEPLGGAQDARATASGATGSLQGWQVFVAFGATLVGSVLVSSVAGPGLAAALSVALPAVVLGVVIFYGIQGAFPGMAGNGGMGR
jgi:hypothetical protein